MSFSLSPGVYSREIDLSTTIPAVATSIAVNVIRKSYKGPEYEQYLVTNTDELIDTFGIPTDESYLDLLSSVGFLKYGSMLYTTRVMPDDATFAGTKILTGVNSIQEEMVNFTFNATGEVVGLDGYEYTSLGTTDISMFPEMVDTLMGSDDPLWVISKYRGKCGNDVRVLVYNADVYNAVKYFDVISETYDIPYGMTISASATAAVVTMFDEYKNNPDFGTVGYKDNLAYPFIKDMDTPMTDTKQFVVVVQAKDQGSTMWEDKESFVVSSDETAIDDTGNSMFVETVINEQSRFINIALNPLFKTTNTTDAPEIEVIMKELVALTGGQNGEFGRHSAVPIQDGEDAACIEAYNLYSNPEEIDVNLFIESAKGVTVKTFLVELCESTRKDCFAILDVLRSHVLNNKGSETLDMVKWRKGQGGSTFNPNTSYAAIYGNWIEVFDTWNKKYRWIPTSGHMAGLYAHTDDVADAWWAPAGLNRAILTGVRRLAFNPTEGNRDAMYVAGINPIVSFSGQGKVVWGQKTLLDKQSAFNRVNVRRLFLVLEKAIAKASKFFLFEMSDEITWMLLTNMIEPFLRDVQGRRGIMDFRVQIDGVTNTPERIDRNELWGNIFIKPTRAAEFIRLNFIATKSGASFEELISSGAVL